MAKFKLDFNLEAWVRSLEVEADNEDDALAELYKMSISEIIEKGYVNDYSTNDVDVEVISKSYEIEVIIKKWNDKYLDNEDDVELAKYDSLPEVANITLEDLSGNESLEVAIEDELEYEFDFRPEDYTFKILREF